MLKMVEGALGALSVSATVKKEKRGKYTHNIYPSIYRLLKLAKPNNVLIITRTYPSPPTSNMESTYYTHRSHQCTPCLDRLYGRGRTATWNWFFASQRRRAYLQRRRSGSTSLCLSCSFAREVHLPITAHTHAHTYEGTYRDSTMESLKTKKNNNGDERA
ncbi:hypothetical protein Trydic_g12675 [Trypoxylus dichotomus]